MADNTEKVDVQNVNIPGQTTRVNARKYRDMKRAMEALLPAQSPGLTQKDIQTGIKNHVSDAVFPSGKTTGWWAKTVQLDLEAKGLLVREQTRPLRWYRNT